MSRYWAYTTRYVPREPLFAAGDERIHDAFLQHKIDTGEEYEPHCLDIEKDDAQSPEEAIKWINDRFGNIPLEELVEKRPISKEEYEAWVVERERFAADDCAYLRGERKTPAEW